MAKADIIRFQELLNSDAEFQEKFKTAIDNYSGEKEEQEIFEKVILPLGEEYGLSATYEEFTAYVKTLSEYDQTELSEDELTQVAGGKVNAGGAGSLSCEKYGIGFGFVYGSEGGGFCFIMGGGPEGKRYDAICVTLGTSDI